VLFERGAKKLGLHPFPAPVAILSKPYKGRQACTHCGLCERFGCEVRAKSSTLAAMIPAALQTGRCQLRTHCYVRKIETNKAGRATGVIYFDARGKEHRQRAKAVVVCANGAETPRLLLLSKSAQFPDGLANSSGQVGRNLMVDNGSAAMGLFPEQLNEFKGTRSLAPSGTITTPTPTNAASGAVAVSMPASISTPSPSPSMASPRTFPATATASAASSPTPSPAA
jgi:choline dehydrogenase-like flavoprotein